MTPAVSQPQVDSALSADRIQLCGQFAVRLGGRQRASELRGFQGRALLAFLVFERNRPVDRFDAIEALWGEHPPAAATQALRALLSNIRQTVGQGMLAGRQEIQLRLRADTWIDVEVAARAAHDAEAAAAMKQWPRAWIAAHVAMNIAERPLLPRWNGAWIDGRRADLARIRLRALEALAASGLGLGGPELQTVVRAAQSLIAADPYLESGYRFMMQAMALEGNTARALLIYDELRVRLREELGIAPSEQTLQIHRALLNATRGAT